MRYGSLKHIAMLQIKRDTTGTGSLILWADRLIQLEKQALKLDKKSAESQVWFQTLNSFPLRCAAAVLISPFSCDLCGIQERPGC